MLQDVVASISVVWLIVTSRRINRWMDGKSKKHCLLSRQSKKFSFVVRLAQSSSSEKIYFGANFLASKFSFEALLCKCLTSAAGVDIR